MAARLKPFHAQEVRDKIKASQLVNHLQAVALDEKQVSPESLRASEILLRKVLPDLKATEHSGDMSVNIHVIDYGRRHDPE